MRGKKVDSRRPSVEITNIIVKTNFFLSLILIIDFLLIIQNKALAKGKVLILIIF
jgi:hypothetical protein